MYFSIGNVHARMKSNKKGREPRQQLIKNTTLLLAIAHRIKQLRKSRGITQVGFFLDTNIHIGRIETGKVNVSIVTLQQICTHLNISLSEFFSDLENNRIKADNQQVKLPSNKLATDEINFLSDVAPQLQDLTNSLQMLSGYVSQTTDQVKREQLFEGMNERINQLSQQINHLYEIATVDKKAFVVKKVDFKEIMDFILLENSENIQNNHIEIKTNFKLCQHLYYVEAYILTIFTQLIKQAFTRRIVGHTLKITLQAEQKKGLIKLICHDNGKSLELEKHPTSQFNLSPKLNAAVLGIYLIKVMVEKNGGCLEIESEQGKGTTLILYLNEYNLASETLVI